MQPLPEVLSLAGLQWREALPEDLKRVVSDWNASGLQRFINGSYDPLPEKQATIDRCRRFAGVKEAPWPNREFDEGDLRERNLSTLKAIWNSAGKTMIRRELSISKPVVVYDVDNPSIILGWGCPGYVYVIHAMRHQGIGSALRDAVGV